MDLFKKIFNRSDVVDDNTQKKIAQNREVLAETIKTNNRLGANSAQLNSRSSNLDQVSNSFHNGLEQKSTPENTADALNDWIDDDIEQPPLQEEIAKDNKKLNKAYLSIAGVCLLVIIAGGIYLFTERGGIQAENIIPRVTLPATVESGSVFNIEVQIQNLNKQALVNTSLITKYGTYTSDDQGQSITTTESGLVAIEQTKKLNIPIIITGTVGDKRMVEFEFEYSPPDSSARLVKRFSKEIVIERSPISIQQQFPSEITTGETLSAQIRVSTTDSVETDENFGYELIIEKPNDITITYDGFFQEEANRLIIPIDQPVPGSAVILELSIRSEMPIPGPIVIESILRSGQVIVAQSKVEFKNTTTPLVITDNSKDGVVKDATNDFSYVLRNTTDNTIRDVETVISVEGVVSNVVVRDGMFVSANNKIIYNPNTLSNLASLSPGEDITISFSLNPLSGENLNIATEAFGYGGLSSPDRRLLASTNYLYPVRSGTSASGFATYRRSNVINQGPLPPRVGQSTSYTVTLQVDFRQADSRPVSLQANLPNNVSAIDALPEGVSVSGPTLSWNNLERSDLVTFQVLVTPIEGQIGQVATLLEDIVISYTDGLTMSSGRVADITTDITRDSGYQTGIGIVQ